MDAHATVRSGKTTRRMFIALAALAGAIAVFVLGRELFTPRVPPSDETVKAEYLNIPLPPGVRTDKPFEYISKYGSKLATNRHWAEKPGNAVLEEYRSILTQQGWNYHGRFGNGRQWGEDYCKGNLLASVEIIREQGSRANFAFSVSWGSVSENSCT